MTDFDSFVFRWRSGYNFEKLQTLRGYRVDTPVRACYLSTECYRIYLVYTARGTFEWVPYVLTDNALRVLNRHLWKVTEVRESIFESEKQLLEEIRRQMVMQWRDSVESYYFDLSADDVKAALGSTATIETLQQLHFPFYSADVEADPEWDGAIEVPCKQGLVVIPYVNAQRNDDPYSLERWENSSILLTKYLTFVPYSRVNEATSKVTGWIDSIVSFIHNIHWSSLRLKIDSWR